MFEPGMFVHKLAPIHPIYSYIYFVRPLFLPFTGVAFC